MRLIKSLFVFVTTLFVFYLFGSFVCMDFNPVSWGTDFRAFIASIAFISAFFAMLVVAERSELW